MKLFIWEGNGISTGYHDDGTLVVLAENPEQARELAIVSAKEYDPQEWPIEHEYNQWADGWGKPGVYGDWKPGEHNPAIDREPDRIVDLGQPCVVAWNGGGYD